MWLPLRPFGWMTGNLKKKKLGKEWLPNDGLVNIPAAHHPFKDPWQDFDAANIKPGIWNVMPQEYKDHTSYMGVLEDKEVYKNFFLEIADRVTDLPVIE